jgi:tocopherol cyclase
MLPENHPVPPRPARFSPFGGAPTLSRRWRRIWHPAWFQGQGRTRGYFEGWYFKLVDAAGRSPLAVIPGVALGAGPEEAQAFVQVFDGSGHRAWNYEFPLEAFAFAADRFEVRVGENHFGSEGLRLDLRGAEATIRGEVRFDRLAPWPVRPLAPGAMGWYAFTPAMECYHGVLSFQHRLEGELVLDGRTLDLRGGRGYLEKDWGTSFPAAWIWMQSNHFEGREACLIASVAKIPWRGSFFTGFIAGLWLDGRLHAFTTYGGARLRELQADDRHVQMAFTRGPQELRLRAARTPGAALAAPREGRMQARIVESLTAEIEVELLDRSGQGQEFRGTGRCAGLEVGGATAELLAGLRPAR